MSKIYVLQHNTHPNPPSSALGMDLSSCDASSFPGGCSLGASSSSSALSQSRISPNPTVLGRTTSINSTSTNSSGSKEKKSVVFQLENNQICEPQQTVDFEYGETNYFDNFQGIHATTTTTAIASSSSSCGVNYSCTGEEGISSNYHSGSILISKNTSPFRPGGRGSKMLAKAIEQSHKAAGTEMEISSDLAQMEPQWVLCTGKTPCFAKVMSNPSPDSSSVFIQPMHHSPTDNSLLIPWEGHLWLAKNNCLRQVKMKQEPGGWRVMLTSEQHRIVKDLQEKTSFVYPSSYATVKKGETKNWDLVSLESSEFDETGSADSSNSNTLFPLLGSAAGIAVPKSDSDCISSSTASTFGNSCRLPHSSNTYLGSSSMHTPSPIMVQNAEISKTVKVSPTMNMNGNKYWSSPNRRKLEHTPSPAMSGITEVESTSSSPSIITNESCRYLSLSADEYFDASPASQTHRVNRAVVKTKPFISNLHHVNISRSDSDSVRSNQESNYDSDATEPIDESPLSEETSGQFSPDNQLDTPNTCDDRSVLFYRSNSLMKEKLVQISSQESSGSSSCMGSDFPEGHRKPPLSSRGSSSRIAGSEKNFIESELTRPPMPRIKMNKSSASESYLDGNNSSSSSSSSSSSKRDSNRQVYGGTEDELDRCSRVSSTTEILQKYRQKTLYDKVNEELSTEDQYDHSFDDNDDIARRDMVVTRGGRKNSKASRILSSSLVPSSSISLSQSISNSSQSGSTKIANSEYFIGMTEGEDSVQCAVASTSSSTPGRGSGNRDDNDRRCTGNVQLPTTPEGDVDAALHVVHNWDTYVKSTYPWPLLWRHLYALGWRELNIKRVHYKEDLSDMTTVFVPSWGIEKFEQEDKNPANMTKNRDVFVTQVDVRNYIAKYGVCPTDASVTPGGRKRNERRSIVTSFDEENAAPQRLSCKKKLPKVESTNSLTETRTSSAIEMEKVDGDDNSVDNVADNNLNTQEFNMPSIHKSPQGVSSDKEQSPSTPNDHKDAAKHIVNNWEAIRKNEYPFPLLWDRLYNLGWRNIVLKDTSKNSLRFEMQTLVSHVFVPSWSAEKFEDCNQNLTELTKNRDYFLDQESIRNYILKYGTEETRSNVTPEGRRRSKPVVDSLASIVTPHKKLKRDKDEDQRKVSSKTDDGESKNDSYLKRGMSKRKFENRYNDSDSDADRNSCIDDVDVSRKKNRKNEKQSEEKNTDVASTSVFEVNVTLCALQGNTPSPKRRSPKTSTTPDVRVNENHSLVNMTGTNRPARSARARSQTNRDDALGSWPTRFQCSANGSWKL